MDWSDKVEAYNIDEACAHYNNQSTEVQFYPHSASLQERWAGLCPGCSAVVLGVRRGSRGAPHS